MAPRFGTGLGTFLDTVKRSSGSDSIADQLKSFEQLGTGSGTQEPSSQGGTFTSFPEDSPPPASSAPSADPTLVMLDALMPAEAGLSIAELVARTRMDITACMVALNHGIQFGLFRRVSETPPRFAVTPEGREAYRAAQRTA